ncbi:MAG: hypothetical protein NXI04_17250 [Planctomycetaceae bacterium]|nr:hypothetical protein [Planctomycetaceae bacterium]
MRRHLSARVCVIILLIALTAVPRVVAAQTLVTSQTKGSGQHAVAKVSDDRPPAPDYRRSENRIRLIGQTLSDEHPLVIAHRGASGYLPEHTTEAAAFAHALGADFIEQDVVLSQDGVAVVLHDVTLDDITNVATVFPDRRRDGHFYVFDFTLSELRQLNVRERSEERFPQNSGRFVIRTLEEHLQLIAGLNQSRGHSTGVYVEIKQPALHHKHQLDVATEVLRILRQYGYHAPEHRAYVQCFDATEVLRLRTELKCQLKVIQLLSETPSHDTIVATSRVADGIGIPLTSVVSGVTDGKPQLTEVVRTAHDHALLVHVWTLRDDRLPRWATTTDDLISWLVRDGMVDGIFTDFPDTLLQWRRQARDAGPQRGPFHLLRGQADKP